MRFNSKSLLVLVVVVALLGFAYFMISSKKSSVDNSDNTIIATPTSEAGNGGAIGTSANEISLEIASPKDGDIVTKSPVVVSGITVSGADVSVNDAETKADANGEFKVSVPLDEGENEIFITANDVNGNYAEASLKVSLNTE